MNKSGRPLRRYVMLIMATWSAASFPDGALTVSDAWVREAPPQAEVSAAYLTIHNQTDQTHKLIGASSPQFQKIELHEMKLINDQARMRQNEILVIAAHGSVALNPGGLHLMLIKPLQPLKAGGMVDLTLQFDDSLQITIQAPIRKTDDADETPHRHDMPDMKM